MTQTLYYDKSFIDQQSSYHLLYHDRENNLREFYCRDNCDQSRNSNYLSVLEKVTTITTQTSSESSLVHWDKNFISKAEIDAWKAADLCLKCRVTDHWTNKCLTDWLTAVMTTVNANQWLTVNLQLALLSVIENISNLISDQLEIDIITMKSNLKRQYLYIIDNSS